MATVFQRGMRTTLAQQNRYSLVYYYEEGVTMTREERIRWLGKEINWYEAIKQGYELLPIQERLLKEHTEEYKAILAEIEKEQVV